MLCCRLSACALALGLALASANESRRKNPSELAKLAQQQKSDAAGSSRKVYEDEDFGLRIPAGWRISRADRPIASLWVDHPGVVQFPAPGHGLLLTKNGYTLDLNNMAGQTSPVPGGRFCEVFRIPWLIDGADVWACGGYLLEKPQEGSEGLLFFNMVFEGLDSETRKTCDIPKDLVFERRWFAGYFSTAKGMWLFDSDGADCAEKAYTLTSGAKAPANLPDVNDPVLKKIIGEAIDIVGSIHYKRCPPHVYRLTRCRKNVETRQPRWNRGHASRRGETRGRVG